MYQELNKERKMLTKRFVILAMLFCLTAFLPIGANAEFVLEIDEPLTNNSSNGEIRGGRFMEDGWRTLQNTDFIEWDIETCAYGRVEFDVKGLYESNEVFPNIHENGEDEDMHYTLFTMWDTDPDNVWYGQWSNGVRQWHNPYKLFAHVFGWVYGDLWKWQRGRFRVNVGAYWGGYDDDPHAFEIEYGDVEWAQEQTFHVRLEWGQGHMYYYVDDVVYAHADYSSFGTEYAPPHHSMRIGSARGCKGLSMQAPVDITYSNFKFYRNEDLVPPTIVNFNPGNNVNEAPLDSYLSFNMSESLDPNSYTAAFMITPNVDGEIKMAGNTLFFDLYDLLEPNTQYTVYLTTELKDFAGNRLEQPFEASFTTGSGQPQVVEKYGVFELPIVAPINTGNKYTDTYLKGVFQGPTETIEIDGFWNGGDIYKVRMAPTEVGEWTYTISGNNAGFSKSGSFTVVDSPSKGFIHPNPDYPYSFQWDDGTPWLWKGETSWRSYTNMLPFEGRYKDYIDLRSEQGYNAVQSIVVSYINGDAFWANEGGTAFTLTGDGKDYDHLNPGYYQWIDRRLAYANEKGIVPIIFFTWAQEFVKFDDEQFRNFTEHMVARWSAYNVMWVISGEYNEVYSENGLPPDVYIQHGHTIMNKDPYDHPISLHPSGRGSSKEFHSQEWFGFILQQWPIDYHSHIVEDRVYGKPTINGEYAYADWHDNDDVRRGAWDIFTGGGFFSAGFFHTFAPDKGGWDLDANKPEQEAVMTCMNFIEHTEWWKLDPHDELVTNGYCVANLGSEYVVYARDGGPTSLNLSDVKGNIDVQWLDPITGEYSLKEEILGGGVVNLTPPASGEWVLHVGGSFDAEAPAPPNGFALDKP
jgi:hypothetical protein